MGPITCLILHFAKMTSLNQKLKDKKNSKKVQSNTLTARADVESWGEIGPWGNLELTSVPQPCTPSTPCTAPQFCEIMTSGTNASLLFCKGKTWPFKILKDTIHPVCFFDQICSFLATNTKNARLNHKRHAGKYLLSNKIENTSNSHRHWHFMFDMDYGDWKLHGVGAMHTLWILKCRKSHIS